MVEESTDHGNDMMMVQFVFLFLSCMVLQETLIEMDVKILSMLQ